MLVNGKHESHPDEVNNLNNSASNPSPKEDDLCRDSGINMEESSTPSPPQNSSSGRPSRNTSQDSGEAASKSTPDGTSLKSNGTHHTC